jgi:hypothetical protein
VRALSRVPRRSLVDVASCILPIWLILVITHTAADADLWGHLRFGADSIARGGLALVDRYSFTADTTWINHEWLAEVVLAACYAAGGAIALNVMKLAVLAAIALIVWRAGRLAGGSTFSLIALSSLVVFASYTRTQVLRPQLFSILFFAMLLALLDRRDRHVQSGRRPSGPSPPYWQHSSGSGRTFTVDGSWASPRWPCGSPSTCWSNAPCSRWSTAASRRWRRWPRPS